MKNESLMESKAPLPIAPRAVEAGEVRVARALAEPQSSSINAPKAGNIGETKPASRFAAWIHAPFIP